jgi:hypothetical protein
VHWQAVQDGGRERALAAGAEVKIDKEEVMSTPATEQAVQVPDEAKHKLAVSISYNGMNASFEYEAKQTVESVRVRALDYYDIRGADREQEFLFGPDNQTELVDAESMGSQVEPGSQIYLHRRTAGGG